MGGDPKFFRFSGENVRNTISALGIDHNPLGTILYIAFKKSELSGMFCPERQYIWIYLNISKNVRNKSCVDICSFLRNRTPSNTGAQKSFFCIKFPKTKPNSISNSPKRLFQVFRLSTRKMFFSNLPLFENAQNLRDKFWNLVCENRILGSDRAAPFFFEDFLSRLRCEKN